MSPTTENKGDSKKILVKTFLTESEHKLVRHAAAERGLSLGDFLKEAVLADAQRVMDEFVRQLENRAKGK
jgi:uncharacterized protein (DUF1778 family)